MVDLVTEFADVYRRRLEELRQAYRQKGYCGFPWGLIEGLSLGEACRLAPLLCEIGINPGGAPWDESGVRVADLTSDPRFQELSGVERVAARCVRVVDLASDPRFGGDRDWTAFARQVDSIGKLGVPSAPLAVTVMAAAAIQGSRERSHAGDDAPGSSYSDHQKDDEEDVARRVKAFVASIQALQDKLNLPPQWFHASATVDWWQQHGEGLREQAAKLEKRLQSDRDNFGEKGVLAEKLKDARKAFRPGSGNRKGHHPPMVYSAYEDGLGAGEDALAYARRGH